MTILHARFCSPTHCRLYLKPQVWLRNYRLKEERDAKVVVLRFYFEIIGYFSIYLMLAFVFIPWAPEINAALYKMFLPEDSAETVVTMNISTGNGTWGNVSAPASDIVRMWTATRAPMAQLKARMVSQRTQSFSTVPCLSKDFFLQRSVVCRSLSSSSLP